MKKSLFVALVACVALVLSSCEKKKDVVTGISFAQTELDMLTGDKIRLSLKVTPETAEYNIDDVVWETSDTAVAIVSGNGTITALEVGTCNITATYGEFKAVCKVTVAEWFDNLKFTGVYFGVSDTSAYGNELDTISASDGSPWVVKRVKATVILFTEGFYINDEGDFDGVEQGGIIESESPIYWSPKWANASGQGTIFVLGNWYINEAACDTITQCLPVGTVNDQYIENMKLFLTNLMAGDKSTAYSVNMKAAGDEGCEGAVFTVYEYHTTDEGYGEDGYYSAYVPDLFFQKGQFYASNNFTASDYMCSIDAHSLTAKELKNSDTDDAGNFYAYGCYWHAEEGAEGYTWVDEVAHWGADYTYELNADQLKKSAPKYMPVKCHDFETTQKIIKRIHAVPTDNKPAKL